MLHRSIRPDKIAYVPQVKSVMTQLSILEGDVREAYVERQRRMVQDTLDVINQIPPPAMQSLIVGRF